MKQSMILQDSFLENLKKSKLQVSIFLVKGIKLHGRIDDFDQYIVILKDAVAQMVYKHAISTIVPNKEVNLPRSGQDKSGNTS